MMRQTLFLWPLLLVFSAASVWADARMNVLVDVLKLSESAQILSEEGLSHAQDLNADMLDGQGGAGWQMQVERIYAPALMVETVRSALEQSLTGAALEEVIEFFASDLGTEIVTLENAARVTIQDAEVETAARARFHALDGSDDPRLLQIQRYIDSGDMITRNVTSAMNSNYQFLNGLAEGGVIDMSQEEILRDVANDIDETTEDTKSWLFGYLLLAYHPLSDAQLEAYIAFSNSRAGQLLNTALFAGFGAAYEDISFALGQSVALNMTAEEL